MSLGGHSIAETVCERAKSLFFFCLFLRVARVPTSRLCRQNFDKIPKDNEPATKRKNNYTDETTTTKTTTITTTTTKNNNNNNVK